MSAAHIVLSLLAGAAIGVLIISRFEEFNFCERIGLALSGSGAIMAIGPVITENSPFDLWAGGLLRVGLLLFVAGWLWNRKPMRKSK